MRFQAFLTSTRSGRALTLLLLALFVLLCGLYLAGPQHDGHADSFAVIDEALLLLALSAVVLIMRYLRLDDSGVRPEPRPLARAAASPPEQLRSPGTRALLEVPLRI